MNRAHRHVLKDQRLEAELFSRRVLVALVVILAVFLVLLGRYLQLQWLQHDDLSARSDRNRIRLQAVNPNRGLIYDRNGRLLATNVPAYRLELTPERVEDIGGTLEELAGLLDITDVHIQRFEQRRDQYRRFQGVPLRFLLSEQEVARFAVNRHRFPGVEIVPYLTRQYPYDELFTHVLGYVGRIDADDLSVLDGDNYRAATHVGKIGVEQYRESVLHGISGIEQVETNAEGRAVRTVSRNNPKPGRDLMLSLDIDVQRTAWTALGDSAGAVVAVDPRNGDILAFVSKPSFDANLFVNGVSQQAYDEILADAGRPLFNRALKGAYEPGSTFKPFVALAGLESGVMQHDQRVFSSGRFTLPNSERPYRDWQRGGHGWVDVRGALEQSVNTYFYQMALELGIDAMHQYLSQFGFGLASGVDLSSESAGILPSREWKRRTHNQIWFPGETVIAGIGQGANVVTPLQLAAATATLAAQGMRYRPRLVTATRESGSGDFQSLPPVSLPSVPIADEANWQAVYAGMIAVVHGQRGTAKGISENVGYTVAGKTGTAQLFGLREGEVYEEEQVAAHLRHNALFIAFAPAEAPTIAVAVVAEHSGAGSTVAAPIARAVLDAWLLDDAQ